MVLKVTAPKEESGRWNTAQLPCLGSDGDKNVEDKGEKLASFLLDVTQYGIRSPSCPYLVYLSL